MRALATVATLRERIVAHDVAAVVVAVLLLGPALGPGYVLVRDMVFVPDPRWSWRLLGLSGETARAVPSDLVVVVLSQVVPGELVQKAILLGTLTLAGAGAGRLVRGSALGGSVAAVAAVWNPWVGERLAMGHWALLIGYSAVPWVVLLGIRRVAAGGAWLGLGLTILLGSMGGASAQVLVGLALAGVLVTGRWAPRPGMDTSNERRPRRWRGAAVRHLQGPALLFAVAALPWLAPSLASQRWHSDTTGFEVFGVHADLPVGALASVLTGGGVWNADAVPMGRDTVTSMVGSLALLVLGVTGLGLMVRGHAGVGDTTAASRLEVRAIALAGLGGLALVAVVSLPMTRDWVAAVPGGGLLRDATRQAGPWVVATAVGLGGLAHRLAPRSRPVAAAMALMPVAALPTLAWGLLGLLAPVHLPDDVLRARSALDAGDAGAVLVLPFHSNRSYGWNRERPSLTPWSRLVGREVIESSDLVIRHGRTELVVRGENPRAAAVGRALKHQDPAGALARLGVRWVLVDAGGADVPEGLELSFSAPAVRVFSVPITRDRAVGQGGTDRRRAVLAANLVALSTCFGILLRARRSGVAQNGSMDRDD